MKLRIKNLESNTTEKKQEMEQYYVNAHDICSKQEKLYHIEILQLENTQLSIGNACEKEKTIRDNMIQVDNDEERHGKIPRIHANTFGS